jgi:hypothetical protein
MIRSGVLGLSITLGLFAACEPLGPPRPTCEQLSISDAGVDVTPYTTVLSDAQPPEAFGQESDPGPTCNDCTQDRNVEVMTVVDFENGFAPSWFNYGEPGILLEPPAAGGAVDDAGITWTLPPPYWGLQVESLADKPGGTRCGSRYALHMAGGRFAVWGGGAVTRLLVVRDEFIDVYCEEGKAEGFQATLDGRDDEKNGIGAAPRYMTGESVTRDAANGCFFYISPAADQPSLLGIDVGDYDGISFWARKGPSGQSTLRIALVDDNTSEDLNLQQERAYWFEQYEAAEQDPNVVVDPDKADTSCQRIKGCCRHCYEQLQYQEYVNADRFGTDQPYVRDSVADRCWVPGEPMPTFRFGMKFPADPEGYFGWDFVRPGCGLEPTTEDLTDECWQPAQTVWDQWNRDYGLCCPRTMKEEHDDPVEANGDPRWGGKP